MFATTKLPSEDELITYDGASLQFRIHGQTCEIVEIMVPGESRRSGRGRKMVDTLCQICKRREGITVVYAITRANNRIAQKFYESLRFDVSVLRDFYEPGVQTVDALLYSRSPLGPV